MIGPFDAPTDNARLAATTAEQRRRQETNQYIHDALETLPERWAEVVAAYAKSAQAGRAALAALAVELMDVEAAELAARSVA